VVRAGKKFQYASGLGYNQFNAAENLYAMFI